MLFPPAFRKVAAALLTALPISFDTPIMTPFRPLFQFRKLLRTGGEITVSDAEPHELQRPQTQPLVP
jgi:hypothetical protein